MSSEKDFKNYLKAGVEQGWQLKETKKGLQLIPPDPAKEIVRSTGRPRTTGP